VASRSKDQGELAQGSRSDREKLEFIILPGFRSSEACSGGPEVGREDPQKLSKLAPEDIAL